MIKCTCIGKYRDKKGNITGYKLQDGAGQTIDCRADKVKDYITNGVIFIDNLTLTSNNKLVDSVRNKMDNNSTVDSLVKAVELLNKINQELWNIRDIHSEQIYEYSIKKDKAGHMSIRESKRVENAQEKRVDIIKIGVKSKDFTNAIDRELSMAKCTVIRLYRDGWSGYAFNEMADSGWSIKERNDSRALKNKALTLAKYLGIDLEDDNREAEKSIYHVFSEEHKLFIANLLTEHYR